MKTPTSSRRAAVALLGVFVALLVAVHHLPVASSAPAGGTVGLPAWLVTGPQLRLSDLWLQLGDACPGTCSTPNRSATFRP